MKASIIGLGYVGASLASALAKKNEVTGYDVNPDKMALLQAGRSPIGDQKAEEYISSHHLKIKAAPDEDSAYRSAEALIIAVPTNYDEKKNSFDVSQVQRAVELALKSNPLSLVIIKSTIPVGYCQSLQNRYPLAHLVFVPEFLREAEALHDCFYPSRLIIGLPFPQNDEDGKKAAALFASSCLEKEVPTLIMGSSEAEAVKLFSNTYLALRVAFFNELDTYASCKELSSSSIIKGVCLDPRIGEGYNVPSFGYGGYCLPKDTKQLQANYEGVPQNLISAVIASNLSRKRYIADCIIKAYPKDKKGPIGFFHLFPKEGPKNLKYSPLLDIASLLKGEGYEVLLYEPKAQGVPLLVEEDLAKFLERCPLIVSSRDKKELKSYSGVVFTLNED